MCGVYLCAAELSRRGFIVTPTSRNAQGIDLLIANNIGTKTYSIQVKTNATTFNFWLLGEKNQTLKSASLFYIFVNLRKKNVEYYIVPSAYVVKNIQVSKSISKKTNKKSMWYVFKLNDAKKFENKWNTFGNSNE